MRDRVKEVLTYWDMTGKWTNRLRVKSKHKQYINDEISYGDYKTYIRTIVNQVRVAMGYEPFSEEKFDEAWQYRVMAHENWDVALSEIRNVIVGFW